MKKMVVKVELQDEKAKQKALKAVSGISGVESISIEMKDKKLTVIGNVDPVKVVNKLRKAWHTEIVSVGENKKEEPKKAGPKKEEPKKKVVEQVEKAKQKTVVYGPSGVPFTFTEMEVMKRTVIGYVDPVEVANKLSKPSHTKYVLFREPKKAEPKKAVPKKEETKKAVQKPTK